MANQRAQHRSLIERWVVTGNLRLETPAHFGNGEADALTDMPLLLDEVEGRPLLPGTSIAGALRNYLCEIESGYGVPEKQGSLASTLFGGARGFEDGEQSSLIVEDALAASGGFELRDGVAIDADTRTAKDEAKFDIQLLPAGTTFPLRFELLVNKNDNGQALRNALATALHGLETGEITLGTRKRRGFGQCTVTGWQVWKYDLKNKNGLLAWLAQGHDWPEVSAVSPQTGSDLAAKLDDAVLRSKEADGRKLARLSATFTLDGTLMIRSGFGASDTGPDMVHLHSPRAGRQERVPVLPGTSWAGVLRHRALKIARTVSGDDKEKAQMFVEGMFGPSKIDREDSKHAKASRISIKESEIVDASALVVTRVKIDRFTGGAFESALFSEQPAVGKSRTHLSLYLNLRKKAQPDKSEDLEKAEKEFQAEVGLLLLLLKDLWTGELPLGGESGIGRGRLQGLNATLTTPDGEWKFKQEGEKLVVTPEAETLEGWVGDFNAEVKKAQVAA